MSYLLAIASMDSVFVGPFGTEGLAAQYAALEAKRTGFDFLPYSEAEVAASVARFGPCPIQAPLTVC